MAPLIGLLGHKAAQKALGRKLDVGFGVKLFKDKRISPGPKLISLAIGVGLTAVLLAVEAPLEAIVAFVLPVIGGVGDLIFDGLEVVLFPLMIAALVLPYIAPKVMVEYIKQEMAGFISA